MSDVDTIREAFGAFGRGDIPAVLAALDPDIEWVEPEGYPWGDVYRGHDRVVGLFQTAAEMLGPDWRVEPDRFVATEDGVLVTGRHTGARPDGTAWEVPLRDDLDDAGRPRDPLPAVRRLRSHA